MNSSKNSLIAAGAVALVASILVCTLFWPHNPAATPTSSSDQSTYTADWPDQDGMSVGALSYPTHSTPERFPCVGNGRDYLECSQSGTIGVGQNQASWKNTTGRTVYVDVSAMYPSGVASTTMIFYIGTSTASTITDFTAPFSTLVDGKRIATSTAPIVINNSKDGGTNGRVLVDVAAGAYINFAMLQGYLQNTCATTFACEAATSTNRGFTSIQWYVHYFYKP